MTCCCNDNDSCTLHPKPVRHMHTAHAHSTCTSHETTDGSCADKMLHVYSTHRRNIHNSYTHIHEPYTHRTTHINFKCDRTRHDRFFSKTQAKFKNVSTAIQQLSSENHWWWPLDSSQNVWYTVEPLYCGHHGTTTACPDYRCIHISEASSVFPVGMAMHPCCWLHSRALPCCTLARKADQRPVLYIPVLLYCPVVELLSSGGERQASVRIIQWILYSAGTKRTEESVRFTE